ncbi:PREDICTED: uncharacterized protein LOC109116087 [Tarenaya hassleriana]|uniref:uncharacterized protein LOC109116087 n=1 Tax=Tarenaya hassleriana TaxID=28532 RepID=UPI0008FD9572|nr:PREDICTED: uncharacterized protein LOC109116087 [Tarenaya hassleriana]
MHKPDGMAFLLLYVDDIILTASSPALLQRIIQSLNGEFTMTDLGKLHYFLGVQATDNKEGLFLCQTQYAVDILHRANMEMCSPCLTPADTKSKLSAEVGEPVADPTLYRSLAGALQYLTFTRPDISYVVQQICLFMHDPREPHFNALKRILSLISWSSKRQRTTSRSSAEAEYRVVANAVAETCWLRNLLLELQCPLTHSTVVFCDNISAVYMTANPVQHQRTKHIEIDIHLVREKVALGHVHVLHVPSSSQFADIFTKGLSTSLFLDF